MAPQELFQMNYCQGLRPEVQPKGLLGCGPGAVQPPPQPFPGEFHPLYGRHQRRGQHLWIF